MWTLRRLFQSNHKKTAKLRQRRNRLKLEGLEQRDLLTSLGADIVGFGGGTSTDEFWVSSSDGAALSTSYWQDISPSAGTFDFQGVGDFNGDQIDDVVTRNANGQFVVSISDGSGSFNSSVWGDFTTITTWTDILIGDFNADGRDDILGRADSDGTFWLAESQGNRFQNSHWGGFLNSVVWTDFREGDFNGDGRSDIAARAQDGTWWAGISNGTRLNNAFWGRWSTNVTWSDVSVGDFNGDGLDDIAGRANNTSWWVNRSSGNDFFFVEFWSSWSDVTWEEVVVGDFDGDNSDDIAGLASNGQWWVANSNTQRFQNEFWNTWPQTTTFDDVLRIDFNNDGRDDIFGRGADGSLWVSVSDGNTFNPQRVGQLPATSVWQNTLVGDFDVTEVDVEYQVTFTAQWTTANGFGPVPGPAHFSPVIGAAVNGQSDLWAGGQLSSPGIEELAETGVTTIFQNEINAEVAAGTARSVSLTDGTDADTSVSMVVAFNQDFPLFTLATMVAPSSDWFVGVHNLSLQDAQGNWIDQIELQLPVYDAGTEDGTEFALDNPASNPLLPIQLLNGLAHGGQLNFVDGLVNGNAIAQVEIVRIP